MAYGLNTTNLANPILNAIAGSSFVISQIWVQLHTGDPGAAGTANLSANTTRALVSFAPASIGTLNLASIPTSWNMTTTETLAALSFWSASSAGTPYWTAQLPSTQPVNNGDTVTLTTCELTIGPLAV